MGFHIDCSTKIIWTETSQGQTKQILVRGSYKIVFLNTIYHPDSTGEFSAFLPAGDEKESHQKYGECAKKLYCGSFLFRYPFWSNSRPQYCGSSPPIFNISCESRKNGSKIAFINIKSQKFHIIHQTQSGLRIAPKNCPSKLDFPFDYLRVENRTSKLLNLSICPGGVHPFQASFNCTVKKPVTTINETNQNCTKVEFPVLKDVEDPKNVNLDKVRQGFDVRYISWDAYCRTCNSSGGICGSNGTNTFECFCPKDRSPSEISLKCKKGLRLSSTTKAGIAAAVSVSLSVMLSCLVCHYCRRREKRHFYKSDISRNMIPDPRDSPQDFAKDSIPGVHFFNYYEIAEATESFNDSKELGDGGFGTVYYGKLQDGREIAVKRLHECNYKRIAHFLNEIVILARLEHPNLMSLHGCASRSSLELLLIYEYVSNGTLANAIHAGSSSCLLPWPVRLNIAIEAANALSYLHSMDIIHRDIKSQNILLDSLFHVKIADFGLSRLFPLNATHVSTAPQGTPGYIDPEYHQFYQLTYKSDVYSFGVVLIELISSMPAVDVTRQRHAINLSNMARIKIQNNELSDLVDQSFGFGSEQRVTTTVRAVAELAFRCLQEDKELRPSMTEVFQSLRWIQEDGYGPRDGGSMKHNPLETKSPISTTVSWERSKST